MVTDYHYYMIMMTDVSAEAARQMEVHLTFGQQWRERVVSAIEEGGVTMICFKSAADLEKLYPGQEIMARIDDGPPYNRPEIDLYFASESVDNKQQIT